MISLLNVWRPPPYTPPGRDTRRCKLHDVTWYGEPTSRCFCCEWGIPPVNEPERQPQ